MKRYRFDLERVLKLRQYREREWELKLAEASGACLALSGEIESRQSERRRILATRFELAGGDVNVLASSERYLKRLGEEERRKREELARSEAKRDEVRERYLVASRERKVLDRLKEKRSARYYRLADAEEIAMIDDVNNAIAARS